MLSGADSPSARRVAERLRAALAAQPLLTSCGPVDVTISVGVATGDGTEAEALLQQADLALYEAKAAGRNRIGCPLVLDVAQLR